MTALDDRTSAPPRAPHPEFPDRPIATPPRAPRDESPESLAETHARTRRGSRLGLRRWLSALDRRLGEVYARLARSPEAVAARPLAAEWLLDNQHVIQEALQQVAESLPRRFHRELPALAEGPLAGKARVYAVARALVERGDGHVELDVAPRFLAAYQERAPLSMGELWALPAMLRLVVLEELVTDAERLFAPATSSGSPSPDAADRLDLTDTAAGADSSRIPVYILGLRELATQDWRTFFEEASRVEALLRADPAGVYPQMDFATRDAYRKAVEGIAREGGRRGGEGEEAVARIALELSGERFGDGRRAHVGWWLVDRGKAELPGRLGLREPLLSSLTRRITPRSVGLYLASVVFGAAALLAGALAYAARTDATALQTAVLVLVSAVPALTVAVAYVNWIVTHAVVPRLLPKLDTDALDDERHRAIIVVPCVMTGVEDLRQQLRELEINYLGNSSPLLSFALLVDLADAAFQHLAGDAALVEAARLGIEKLNERHRRPDGGPFHLLHRERRWNGRENLWMGWERKRGKLHEFNRLVLGREDTTFVGDGRLADPRRFRYVITVDADTFLPPTAALRLVATLAHPLNEPELDAGGAVVGGYTVLQPRLETLPASASSSAFARVFEADTGLDLYTHAVSDVYQDLAGEGIFAGKGIYRVDAFERSLEGRVPENALLSHDLFEGLLGRAGLVSDIALFEHFPAHVLTYMRRLHRWVRGDWQLLPWLAARVPASGGRRIRHRLSGLDRWKIFDNLRRSLLAPSLLGMLVAGWLWLPGRPWAWTLIVAAVLATPIFLQGATTVNQVVRARRVRETVGPTLEPPGLLQGLRSLGNDAWRLFLGIAFLPFEAYVVADAIVRTLWRLVSRRRLLEWTTAARAAQAMGRRASTLFVWRSMAAAPLLALAILAVVVWLRPEALPGALPFLLLWLVSPGIAHRVSRPRQPPSALPVFLAPDRAALRRLARRTWLYFQHFIGPEDAWLPPDNFQEEPGRIVARRTSPTNIGLSLLSALAAHDLGYAGTRTLAATLRNVFDGLDRLERHRGHFLNWYDTRALVPLSPRYVSTVDSGNLAACLLTLSTAMGALTQAPILPRRLARGFLDTLALLEETVRRVEELEAAESRSATSAGGKVGGVQGGAPASRSSIEAAAGRIRERATAAVEEPTGLAAALAEVSDSLLPELESLVVALVVTAPAEIEPALVRELRIWIAALREDLVLWQKEVEALAPWLGFLARPPALYRRRDFSAAASWVALRTALPGRPQLGRAPKACRRARKRLAHLQAAVEKAAQAGAAGVPGAGAERIPDDVLEEARTWNAGLSEALELGIRNNETLLADLREVSAVAERLVAEMDFDFLFDRRRCLFHIGYDATAGSPDPNYYDLLASEARLASFVAIAKGNVPPAHWLHLGRPFARVNGTRALLSWGGTMFEYLMPSLLMRHPGPTLLGLSCRAAVDRQIAHGAEVDAPWGVSESGFAELDPRANYRYAAFGVPGLGLKRDLGRRLVVSPYASLLALPFRPRAVEKNIEALERLGMLGRYGLFEALDLGRAELPREPRIVQSYMTHHQGMILLALVNALRDRTMVTRFHAHPLVATAEYLLHERIPWHAPLRVPLAPDGWRRPATLRTARADGWPVPRHPVLPQIHVLSNGSFSVWITASGASGSRWRNRALTRWRPDPTVQGTGQRLYVQDAASGGFWAVGRDPVPEPGQHDVVRFAPHTVQFSRRRRGIGVKMEVTVPPADDLEIRRVRLVNHAGRSRRLALVTYAEPVLAPPADDRRHPAFQKLFLETAWLPEHRALLVKRRLGSAADEPVYVLHALLYGPVAERRVTFETDRARFLGRFGSARRPAALAAGALPLHGTTGATLDPVLALRCVVELAPRAEAELVFVTVVGRSRADVLAPLERYRSAARVEWAFRQARARSEQELQELGIVSHQAREMQELLSALFHPSHALRAEPETLAANRLSRRELWRHGISGDNPVLLVRVERAEDAPVAREALLAHAFWRGRRVEFDVVIVNDEPLGYALPLQERLEALIAETEGGAWRDQRAGIFLLRGVNLTVADRTLLSSAAAVLLDASRGSLAQQLERLREQPLELPGFVPMPSSPIEPQAAVAWTRRPDLIADNGLGGFSGDGREYVIELAGDRSTPAPWCNVIANPGFGFLISESGGGFTWAAHSAENRLTPWRNDPVVDEPGEALYLRDEETGEIWSPTPQPAGGAGGPPSSASGPSGTAGDSSGGTAADSPYRVRHGAGYTVFEHHRHGLAQQLTLFAARDEPVKVVHLRVENRWSRPRRITATYYAEWVLGESREDTLAHIVPDYDYATGALLARNTFHATFDDRVAFLAASREPHGLTTDRREFLGADGALRRPAALSRIGLSGTVRPGTDPCAALQVHLDLAPGETQEVHFLLGQGVDRDHAVSLANRFRNPAAVAAERERVDELWDGILGTVSVATPDRAMDLVLNRWLLYQALACRVWGRSALYQSSGAFGFRDQLQDVLPLVHGAPHLARAHLLEAARHQFEEGDVLHWWHPPAGEGVRTRCSDDLLWLPYAVAAYVRATGDAGVLDEEVPYLTAEPLRPHEKDRYTRFESGTSGSLYEHCLRAIERGDTAGRHGLPLMGAHDWNDGLNRVGIGGEGESVWLAWFLRAVLQAFAPICERHGESARAATMRDRADALAGAVEASAWDGRWYLRAWYDDGSTLGSSQDLEARIDSLPQSWAVLAGGDPDRAGKAMESVLEHLVRGDPALCCLFWPPFDRAPRDPGYVKGYPPGVRENGGQYSHAAAWVGWAFAARGDGDRAHAVFDLLNPVRRAETPAEVDLYRVEPYVIAADVYSHPPHVGRGGWTWYTGSAGWTWRLGVEVILGLRREAGGLRIDPCIPHEWPGFQAVYRVGRTSWRVSVENPDRVSRGVEEITLDGTALEGGLVPLDDDGGEHVVVVRMGAGRPTVT